MANAIDTKVKQIRTFFKKNQPKNHPILEHPISKCEEYVRGLYFDMLCVMAQYENEDVENQNRFIQRIMAGCEESMPITEHIKRAMEISADKVEEFLKQCKENNLSEIFFVDSLLIACANGAPNKKQVEFLAEIGDVLGFDKGKMQYLTELAVSILEQDSEKYETANAGYEEEDKSKLLEQMLCYFKEFVSGLLIDTPTYKYYYAKKQPDTPLFDEETIFYNLDSVVIENQFMNQRIEFQSVKSVILRNCTIQNLTKHFNFDSVETITIENCHFDNCGQGQSCFGGALYFEKCTNANINIISSKFVSCKVSSSYDGGVAYVSCSFGVTITFIGCEFDDCKAGYGSILYDCNNFNATVKTSSCYFSNCSGDYLFSNYEYQGENNKIIGCCSEHN